MMHEHLHLSFLLRLYIFSPKGSGKGLHREPPELSERVAATASRDMKCL